MTHSTFNTTSTIFLIALSIVISSCTEDDSFGGNDNAIGFSIPAQTLTRSGTMVSESTGDDMMLVSNDGKDTLVMSLSVTDNSETPQPEQTFLTRGARINTSRLFDMCNANIGVQSFFRGEKFFGSYLSYSFGTTWTTPMTYYWPSQTEALDFWAWAPKTLPEGGGTMSVAKFGDGNHSLSFDYWLPSPDESQQNDAERQPDIILAHTQASARTFGGAVPFVFDHPLSAVRFKVIQSSDFFITTVSLDGVKTKGHCLYQPDSTDIFVWSDVRDAQSFTQAFNTSITETEGHTAQEIGTEEATFLFIPQELNGTDQTVTFEFIKDGDTHPSSATAMLPAMTWEAGKVYTYTVELFNGDVSVEVSEDFTDPNVKKDVRLHNTGTANAHVRTAVIANWLDANGNILSTCDFTTSGTLSGLNTTDWIRLSDGFFYYRKALRAGAFTKIPLFTSYTPPSPPEPGSHFEMTIIAQAVEWKKAEASWSLTIGTLDPTLE